MTGKPEEGGNLRVLAGRVVIGAAAVTAFAFFAFVVGPGIFREAHPPERTAAPSSETAKGSTGWLDPADAPARKGRVLPPIDPDSVLTPHPLLLERGRQLYRQNCVSCHGEQGHGDGAAASTLNPKPRDFTRRESWTNGYHVTDVFRTISSGVKGTGMAAFDYLPLTDRMALAHLVRSFGKFDHGAEDPGALAELRSRLAQTGGKIPNRIPVSAAMAKLETEAPKVAPLAMPADSESRALVSQVIADPERAARTLAELTGKNDANLANALSAGAPANGFRPLIATLGPADWRTLGLVLLKQEPAHPEGHP